MIPLPISSSSHRFGLGDIALDDIVVYTSCKTDDRLCTFEDPTICNYASSTTDQYNWIRVTGDDPIATGFKPPIDHTDGTSNGAYMMIDVTKPSALSNNQRARLTSPMFVPNGDQCVEYWYYTDAEILSSNSRLKVFVRTSTQSANATGYLIGTEQIFRVRIRFYSAR